MYAETEVSVIIAINRRLLPFGIASKDGSSRKRHLLVTSRGRAEVTDGHIKVTGGHISARACEPAMPEEELAFEGLGKARERNIFAHERGDLVDDVGRTQDRPMAEAC